mmetsp:Transcript_2520/g.5827  ORF Transcript_2520/g.5827 Transcript_2520/m.5827 type:complete len:202 (+) Transcript_2520:1841-2446(+)
MSEAAPIKGNDFVTTSFGVTESASIPLNSAQRRAFLRSASSCSRCFCLAASAVPCSLAFASALRAAMCNSSILSFRWESILWKCAMISALTILASCSSSSWYILLLSASFCVRSCSIRSFTASFVYNCDFRSNGNFFLASSHSFKISATADGPRAKSRSRIRLSRLRSASLCSLRSGGPSFLAFAWPSLAFALPLGSACST